MRDEVKDILTLTVKNAVLEAFAEHQEKVTMPLERRVNSIETNQRWISRGAKAVGAVLIALISGHHFITK